MLVCGTSRPASAHAVGVSRGEYVLRGETMTATLQFAQSELAAVLPEVDTDRDGSISDREIRAGWRVFDQAIVQRIGIVSPAGRCAGRLQSAALAEEDGLIVIAAYRCPAKQTAVSATLAFVDLLTHGHRHVASVTTGGAVSRAVTYAGHAEIRVAPTDAPDAGVSRGQLSLLLLAIPALVWLRRRH